MNQVILEWPLPSLNVYENKSESKLCLLQIQILSKEQEATFIHVDINALF